MSARLTGAKMSRWMRDLEKTLTLVTKAESEARELYLSSTGGRYSDIRAVLAGLSKARLEAESALDLVSKLEAGEARRKGRAA